MPEIRIENLHFRYPPFHADVRQEDVPYALAGIDLVIPEGEFLGIIGTTGSGKSSLCLTLNGLIPQQTGGSIRGSVLVGDHDTRRVPVVQLATQVGIVFQDPEANFVGLTVEDEVAFGLENLAVPPAQISERVENALAMVGMEDVRQRSVATLSGGQKQRVALAAVMAMEPDVLVLDDPTAELDPVGRQDVLAAISALRIRRTEMTIILASSDPEPVAEFADRVLVLHEGRMLALGSTADVFAESDLLRASNVTVPEVVDLASLLNRDYGTAYRFSRYDETLETLRHDLP